MMRKMAGAGTGLDDEQLKYAAAGMPPGFVPPGSGPRIPENVIYNPKFHAHPPPMPHHPSYGGYAPHQPPGGAAEASHLHKMEGLLKPCFDPDTPNGGFPGGAYFGGAGSGGHGYEYFHKHAGGAAGGGGMMIKQETGVEYGGGPMYRGGGGGAASGGPTKSEPNNEFTLSSFASNGKTANSSGKSDAGGSLDAGVAHEQHLSTEDGIDKLSSMNDADSNQ